MNCNECKMKDTTTEIEVTVRGKKIKALNVPAVICNECAEMVVDSLTEKLVRTYAKGCKEDTFDFAEINPRGVGISLGKG